MKVYRVIDPKNLSTPDSWQMLAHGDLGDAIFVTRSVDQALAWALQLAYNLDDWRCQLQELEVSTIRDLTLQPTNRWLKSDPMSWDKECESPFDHPRMERVKSKWHRYAGDPERYSRWLEFGEDMVYDDPERDTPYLVEALVLPQDIISTTDL